MRSSQITLRIGRRVFRVTTLAEASCRYAQERERSGLGASRFPGGKLTTTEGEELRVSYNARIWREHAPRAELVYDPAAPRLS